MGTCGGGAERTDTVRLSEGGVWRGGGGRAVREEAGEGTAGRGVEDIGVPGSSVLRHRVGFTFCLFVYMLVFCLFCVFAVVLALTHHRYTNCCTWSQDRLQSERVPQET